MQISEIKLKYFRQFDQFRGTFIKGLNIVKGPNEAGKSTLQEAIVIGIFDRPTGKGREQQYQQWGRDRLYEIELTYLLDGGAEYILKKDYQAGSLELVGPEGTETAWSRIKSELERALGTRSEKLYLSTASIRQDAMAEIGEGQVEISGQLQRIVMGAEAEVEGILKKLSTALADLERGVTTRAPVNPGEIKQWMDRLAVLDQEIESIRPTVDRRERAQEEIDQFRERLQGIEGELQTSLDVQERYLKRRELIQELEQQKSLERELETRLQKVQSAMETKTAALSELEKYAPVRNLDADQLSKLGQANENLKARITEAQVREKDLHQIDETAGAPLGSRSRTPWVTMIVGVVLGVIGFVFLQNPELNSMGWPLFILGLGGLVGGGIWLLAQRRGSVVRDTSAGLERERLQERYQEGVRSLEEAKQSLISQLKEIELEDWDAFEHSLAQIQELETELETAEATLTALLDKADSADDLERERKEVSRVRRDRQEALEELSDAPELSATAYEKLANNIVELENERENLKTQITRLGAILDEPSHTIEDLHQGEERRAADQRMLERAQEQAAIYHLTLEGLTQARQDTLRTAKDELEPRLGEYLGQMTQGRYSTAFVDDDLAIRVSHGGREEPVAVEELSRGTQDQVYLAARLALSDLVFHDARPPILMDDPFVTFDPQRRQAALELCRHLAADRQIILFTCHEGYAEYADKLIELP